MNKTALQLLIETYKQHQVDARINRDTHRPGSPWHTKWNAEYECYSKVIAQAESLIPTTERQQLEDAWKAGNAARGNRGMRVDNATASDYYTTTYKTT